jgi:glyoxylase-like metal-dependent hydrolase (beta-lactamase superfamily II)
MHEAEIEAATERGVRNIVGLTGRETFGDDLHGQPTPGHTPGTYSYLYTNPDDALTYAFTGDTFTNFTVDRFETVLGFHSYDGNLADIKTTLDTLRDLSIDVLVPGLANGTINAYRWTAIQRRQLLDHCRAQLSD